MEEGFGLHSQLFTVGRLILNPFSKEPQGVVPINPYQVYVLTGQFVGVSGHVGFLCSVDRFNISKVSIPVNETLKIFWIFLVVTILVDF